MTRLPQKLAPWSVCIYHVCAKSDMHGAKPYLRDVYIYATRYHHHHSTGQKKI